MTDIAGSITIGVSAFAATNIDDIFVLMIFFYSLTFPVRQVIFGQYIEIRIADTWTDHTRQHENFTKNVQDMENRILKLIKDCTQPTILHYIGKSAPK